MSAQGPPPPGRAGSNEAVALGFEKWSGAGNDFLLVDSADLRGAADDDPSLLARRLCARRVGVGADGLILLDRISSCARFYNPDGSAAGFCGNGARCLGALLLEASGRARVSFRLGEIHCEAWSAVATPPDTIVTMPAPRVRRDTLPETVLERALGHHLGQLSAAALIEVGVPHLVLLFRGSPCWLLMDAEMVPQVGAAVRRDPFFGAGGTNVSFLCAGIHGDRAAWRLRTYERGVEGETLACGTAAVAAGALLLEGAADPQAGSAKRDGRDADSVELQVASGERLRVERKGPAWLLQGPAVRIFRGVCELPGR